MHSGPSTAAQQYVHLGARLGRHGNLDKDEKGTQAKLPQRCSVEPRVLSLLTLSPARQAAA